MSNSCIYIIGFSKTALTISQKIGVGTYLSHELFKSCINFNPVEIKEGGVN